MAENKFKNQYSMDFNKMRESDTNLETGDLIKIYFSNIEPKLVNRIKESSYVVGCVAWLTNKTVTDALTGLSGCKIIVNKEEYLNPDMHLGKRYYYYNLRQRYDAIKDIFSADCKCCCNVMTKCPVFNKIFGKIINDKKDITSKSGAIIACGIVNYYSRMHHKFLIFFDSKLEPTGVWTGSYNLSQASNYSLENALYITDKKVIEAYIGEFLSIYPYAEKYDWKSGVLCKDIKNNH